MGPSASPYSVGVPEELTRLNTRPARSPVNASTLLLQAAPHDSGPMWVATSHSYDFCIHYTSPVLTGAQGACPWNLLFPLMSLQSFYSWAWWLWSKLAGVLVSGAAQRSRKTSEEAWGR